MGKHADGHHAWPLVDFGLEGQRLGDLQAADIQNMLAIVGHQRRSILHANLRRHVSAHGFEATGDLCCCHGNDFHGQRKISQHRHALGFIGNADKTLSQRRHDLLARQRRTTALDHMALAVDLVGTVDIDGQTGDFIGIEYLDAQGLQALGTGHGAGNGARNLILDGGQCINEFVDCGACAHAHNFTSDHIFQGSLSDQSFQFILRKRCSRCHHEGKSR